MKPVFYLSVPPALFQQVAYGLGEAGLNGNRETARIAMGKSLGRDLEHHGVCNNLSSMRGIRIRPLSIMRRVPGASEAAEALIVRENKTGDADAHERRRLL